MQTIPDTTMSNAWQMEPSPKAWLGWKKQEKWLNTGMEQQKVLNGIDKMAFRLGQSGHQSNLTALSVKQNSLHSGQIQSIAQNPVRKSLPTKGTRQALASALYAAKSSFLTSIGLNRIVPVHVQSVRDSKKTYNLTLDSDNVYYANGILVANCFTFMGMDFIVRKPKKFNYPQLGLA
jgi:hypothetical protein